MTNLPKTPKEKAIEIYNTVYMLSPSVSKYGEKDEDTVSEISQYFVNEITEMVKMFKMPTLNTFWEEVSKEMQRL